MKRNLLFFASVLLLTSCQDKSSADPLKHKIESVTQNEFTRHSVELDDVEIDSLRVESVSLGDFYASRIAHYSIYLANADRSVPNAVEELTNRGDTAMANQIRTNHARNLEFASSLDSLYYKADTSVKVIKADYLLTAQYQGSVLQQRVTKYFSQKDSSEVVIPVSDKDMFDIVNGNDHLNLLLASVAAKGITF